MRKLRDIATFLLAIAGIVAAFTYLMTNADAAMTSVETMWNKWRFREVNVPYGQCVHVGGRFSISLGPAVKVGATREQTRGRKPGSDPEEVCTFDMVDGLGGTGLTLPQGAYGCLTGPDAYRYRFVAHEVSTPLGGATYCKVSVTRLPRGQNCDIGRDLVAESKAANENSCPLGENGKNESPAGTK
jgi:hypothetical protein